MKKYINTGIFIGAIITFVGLFIFSNKTAFELSLMGPSPLPIINNNTLNQIKKNKYEAFILGSSQCGQTHPSIIKDIVGIDSLVVGTPGGDITFFYSMAKNIAAHTSYKPVIVAEFSRYVGYGIETALHRDSLKNINAQNWISSEFPILFENSNYRKFYFDGIKSSVFPFVRYKYSIKSLVKNELTSIKDWIMHKTTQPSKTYNRTVSDDGHSGPFPFKKRSSYYIKNKPGKPNEHKLNLWKKLYNLHCSSNIYLVLCKFPYHYSWNNYYKNTDEKVIDLENFFRSNGVQIIDCKNVDIQDIDCMDAHHFTRSGAMKYNDFFASELARILDKKKIDVTECLTGKKLSEIY